MAVAVVTASAATVAEAKAAVKTGAMDAAAKDAGAKARVRAVADGTGDETAEARGVPSLVAKRVKGINAQPVRSVASVPSAVIATARARDAKHSRRCPAPHLSRGPRRPCSAKTANHARTAHPAARVAVNGANAQTPARVANAVRAAIVAAPARTKMRMEFRAPRRRPRTWHPIRSHRLVTRRRSATAHRSTMRIALKARSAGNAGHATVMAGTAANATENAVAIAEMPALTVRPPSSLLQPTLSPNPGNPLHAPTSIAPPRCLLPRRSRTTPRCRPRRRLKQDRLLRRLSP